jgi:hypothetical protein
MEDTDEADKDFDRELESIASVHISQMSFTTADDAREIAEIIIQTLEEDLAKFAEVSGTVFPEPNSGQPDQRKISGSSSEPILPGDPSKLRLFYEKGQSEYRENPIPELKKPGVDAAVEVSINRSSKQWRRVGGPPIFAETSTQTKEMTFILETKAQLVFMDIYPKPDDWKEPPTPERDPSLQEVLDAVDLAEKENLDGENTKTGPKITHFSNKKKLLQPLRDDYLKDESFWTGSRFKGEYRNRQFYKGHYDHPTGNGVVLISI